MVRPPFLRSVQEWVKNVTHTVPAFSSCTNCVGSPGMTHKPTPPNFLGMDAWMTSRLNVALFRKLHVSMLCLAYFLTCYLQMFTIRHWQTSGRLVQELNVGTVNSNCFFFYQISLYIHVCTYMWCLSQSVYEQVRKIDIHFRINISLLIQNHIHNANSLRWYLLFPCVLKGKLIV